MRITPIRSHDERLTGYVVLLRDVTDRRQTETALRDSELRYRELVENARDLICTCDLDGHILSVNQAGLDLTGYAPEELIGRPLLELVAPESRELATALFAGVKLELPSDRTEIAVIARDGHTVILELAGWVQRRNGVPIGGAGDRPRRDGAAASSRRSCGRPSGWSRWASSPAASPTTSTTC